MPRRLQKSLQDYISKLRNPNPTLQFPPNYNPSSKKKWILLGCKHAKTSSFALDHSQNHPSHQVGGTKDEAAATLADIDRFLFENFKSLYITNDSDDDNDDDEEEEEEVRKEKAKEVDDHSSGGLSLESPRSNDRRRLEIFRSRQSFVAAGSSSSLVEDAVARSSLTTTVSEEMGSSSTLANTINVSTACSNGVNVNIPGDCIALLQYSPNPHDDFRRSMKSMVGARMQQSGKLDWDFMQQLLFCYMNLNEKKSHKFILSAFVDLVVALRQNSDKVSARNKNSKVLREQRRRKLRRNMTLNV